MIASCIGPFCVFIALHVLITITHTHFVVCLAQDGGVHTHTHTHTHTHRYYLNHPDARYNAAHDASDDIEADGPLYKAGSDTNAPLTDEVRSFGPAYRAYSPPLSVRLHYSMERDFPLMRPSPNVFITDCPQDDTEVTGYMDFEGAAACDETQDDTEVTGYMDVEGHAAGDEDEDVEA